MLRNVLVAAAVCAALASPALAHEGNPNFESRVTAVTGVDGVRAQVLNGDDRLELINTSDRTVVVEGYDDEPYARLRGDGTVEVNQRSEATYINEDRYAQVETPERVDNDAPPDWKVVSERGRFEFHDHRIHWMSPSDPPRVKDKSERQKVFDWSVPVRFEGGEPGAIKGTLWWVGTGSDVPGWLPWASGAVALLLIGGTLLVRRRRRTEEASEAW